MGNVQLLIFCWILHLLVKIDDEIFEVYMTDYSQEITKKDSSNDNWRYHHIHKYYYAIHRWKKYLTFLKSNKF